MEEALRDLQRRGIDIEELRARRDLIDDTVDAIPASLP